jgi:hypothetical protein
LNKAKVKGKWQKGRARLLFAIYLFTFAFLPAAIVP